MENISFKKKQEFTAFLFYFILFYIILLFYILFSNF